MATAQPCLFPLHSETGTPLEVEIKTGCKRAPHLGLSCVSCWLGQSIKTGTVSRLTCVLTPASVEQKHLAWSLIVIGTYANYVPSTAIKQIAGTLIEKLKRISTCLAPNHQHAATLIHPLQTCLKSPRHSAFCASPFSSTRTSNALVAKAMTSPVTMLSRSPRSMPSMALPCTSRSVSPCVWPLTSN